MDKRLKVAMGICIIALVTSMLVVTPVAQNYQRTSQLNTYVPFIYSILFTNTQEQVNQLNTWKTATSNTINIILNDVNILQLNMSSAYSQLAVLNSSDVFLQTQITNNLNYINNLTNTLANVSAQLGVLSGTIAVMQITDTNLQAQIDAIDLAIIAINVQIASITGQLASLTATVTILYNYYVDIGGYVTSAYDFIIYIEGTNYVAKYGLNNTIFITNTDFTVVINAIMGTEVLLKTGFYNLTALNTIYLKNNTVLHGEANTILYKNGGSAIFSSFYDVSGYKQYNITISGISFISNIEPLSLSNTDNIILKEIKTNYRLNFTSCANIIIKDSVFIGNNSLYFYACYDGFITGNSFTCLVTGIWLSGWYFTLINNHFTALDNSIGTGIYTSCSYTEITNNIFHDINIGIQLVGTNYQEIISNQFNSVVTGVTPTPQAGTVIRFNRGWTTENQGTVWLNNIAVVTIAHGLVNTPTMVSATFYNYTSGSFGTLWASTINATHVTFTNTLGNVVASIMWFANCW